MGDFSGDRGVKVSCSIVLSGPLFMGGSEYKPKEGEAEGCPPPLHCVPAAGSNAGFFLRHGGGRSILVGFRLAVSQAEARLFQLVRGVPEHLDETVQGFHFGRCQNLVQRMGLRRFLAAFVGRLVDGLADALHAEGFPDADQRLRHSVFDAQLPLGEVASECVQSHLEFEFGRVVAGWSSGAPPGGFIRWRPV